jgi:hypothetical protein
VKFEPGVDGVFLHGNNGVKLGHLS